jgi:hypothetical protein
MNLNNLNFSNGTINIIRNGCYETIAMDQLINRLDCELDTNHNNNQISILNIKDDVFINTLSDKLTTEPNKINKIYINRSIASLNSVVYNNINQLLSNLVCYNLKTKELNYSDVNTIHKQFALQSPILPIEESNQINSIENVELNQSTGYLIGYWLLRGGFYRLNQQNSESPSWSGRLEDIEQIKHVLSSNQTSVTTSLKENTHLLVVFDLLLEHLIRDQFQLDKKHKNIPNWVFNSPIEFITGLFYGLIAANSYLSKDTKNNNYIAVKVPSNFANTISQLIQNRLGIYSKIVGNGKNFLSFKINFKLFNIIQIGIQSKLIHIENFETLGNVERNKEIIVKKQFRAIPWYKFKVNQFPVKLENNISYSFELENNKYYMLSNGLYTSV